MMTNATYAGLRMAARAGKPKPDMEDDETMPDDDRKEASEAEDKGKKKDEKYMTEEEIKAATAAAASQAKADERARFSAVMASEHYQGREKLAATLLQQDGMSADAIIEALSAAPAPSAAPAKADDDDSSARAEMQSRLAAEQPAPTGQAADEQAEPQADNSLVDNMKARYGLAK
jgi:hypothetical protein